MLQSFSYICPPIIAYHWTLLPSVLWCKSPTFSAVFIIWFTWLIWWTACVDREEGFVPVNYVCILSDTSSESEANSTQQLKQWVGFLLIIIIIIECCHLQTDHGSVVLLYSVASAVHPRSRAGPVIENCINELAIFVCKLLKLMAVLEAEALWWCCAMLLSRSVI